MTIEFPIKERNMPAAKSQSASEVKITDDMTLGEYRSQLRSLTPKQRASLEFFGQADYTANKDYDDQSFGTQWGGKVTLEELERYYGRRD